MDKINGNRDYHIQNATDSEKALETGRMRQATHIGQRALCLNCQGAMRKADSNNSATIIAE